MATSRRRTAKKDVGKNLGELESRVKKVERRPRASIGSFSITSDLIAPGSITIDKLDPALLALLQDIADNAGSAGDSSEYLVSGGEDGEGLVTGVVDSVISQYDFSTTSASGKNSIFWQPTEPTGGEYADGDLWYNTSPDPEDPNGLPQYLAYRYNEATGQWEEAKLGDAAFRFIDAGKISTGVLDAGIAIRVGTYPINTTSPVGKARVEITSSFPTSTAPNAPLFTGIRALKKTGAGQGDDAGGLTPLFSLDGESGSLFVGGSGNYLSYNSATDVLSITGKLTTGTGNESLVVGTDAGTTPYIGADGIRLGPNNWWYRPASISSSNGVIFQVGSPQASGPHVNKAIRVYKDGDVSITGAVNPTEGTVTGRLTVRVLESSLDDKFILGRDLQSLSGLSGDEFDGLTLNTYNYWVLSNTGKQTYLRVGNDTNYLKYDPTAGSGGLLSLSGQVAAGTGLFGNDVYTLNNVKRDGIFFNANNHWTLSRTEGSSILQVGSSGKYIKYDSAAGDFTVFGTTIQTAASGTRVELNSSGIFGYKGTATNPIFYIRTSDGKASFEGETNPTGGTVKGKLTIEGTTYAFGKDVMSTPARDGLFLNDNNYWVLSQTGNTATFKVGGDSKYLEWTGGQLNIRTDTLLIGDQTAATQAYADSAAGSAFSSINVLQKLNDSITGVSITSLGYIFSAGKTTYQSDTNGWFIGYNEPPFANPRTPVMYIGNSTNHVKWTGSALEIKGNITGSTFTGGTFRTGSTTDNRVEMIDDSEKDRIRFPLPKSPGGATLSPVESTPAQIRVLPTTAPEALFFRVLQISGATVSGFRPPPAISIVTGTGSTPSTESVVAIDTLSMNIRGPSTGVATKVSMAGSLTITQGTDFGFSSTTWPTINFGTSVSPPMSFTSTISGGLELNTLTFNSRTTISGVGDGTTANRVLGRDANGYLRWYASVSGSGGYSNATDGTTENKITYGGTAPTSGRTAGDIHIEF